MLYHYYYMQLSGLWLVFGYEMSQRSKLQRASLKKIHPFSLLSYMDREFIDSVLFTCSLCCLLSFTRMFVYHQASFEQNRLLLKSKSNITKLHC